MPTRAWPQPLIAVRDVEASCRFYTEILGAEGGHGVDEYEQVVSGGELVLQLHRIDVEDHHGAEVERDVHVNPNARQRELWLRDPDGYRVVVAGPSEYRPRG